ncbi:MAG: hypothetical protein LUQ31_10340 [Methanoregula sp.]|nr:hypothetical protein [Methanoregula sp.]
MAFIDLPAPFPDPQEHVPVIRAGEKIHGAYPCGNPGSADVTPAVVFARKVVYTHPARDDTGKRMGKRTIRDAINAAKAIALSRKNKRRWGRGTTRRMGKKGGCASPFQNYFWATFVRVFWAAGDK